MNILLQGIVGSHAYGLATDTSDVDRAAIYAAPTEAFFNLAKPDESIVTHKPDVTIHEAEKYIRLIRSCNPTAMELLWLGEYETEHWLGSELIVLRSVVLTANRVSAAYMGYATQQVHRMRRNVGHVNKAKNARHVARLLHQGSMLYTNGHLELRLPHADTIRQVGEDAASGDMTALDAMFLTAQRAFDGKSALPSHASEAALERWLVDVRYHFLTERLKDPRPVSAPERAPSPSMPRLNFPAVPEARQR
jgi:uncharacterized protein